MSTYNKEIEANIERAEQSIRAARLAQRSGDIEHSRKYGLSGQEQEGIDIYMSP
ncbi:MAG: hypothetical protein JW881_14600 [Spirochaetales bacterium]|nr:hypothetical protein [Spirochaetales bacterium]